MEKRYEGGIGRFYDRVPLMAASVPKSRSDSKRPGPAWPAIRLRVLSESIDAVAKPAEHVLEFGTRPTGFGRSCSASRVRAAQYQRRPYYFADFQGTTGILALSNRGSDCYREFQWLHGLKWSKLILNASYVRSAPLRPQRFESILWEPCATGHRAGRPRTLVVDAPKPFLVLGTIAAPVETDGRAGLRPAHGLPVFGSNEYRAYVGPGNVDRFPTFSSVDVQVSRRVLLSFHWKTYSCPSWGGSLQTCSTTSSTGTCRTILPARGMEDSSIRHGESTAANSFWEF